MAKDHLARAKDYIAIAESKDSKLAAYKKAADAIFAAREEDPRLTYAEIAARIGREVDYGRLLMRWREKRYPDTGPFARDDNRAARMRYEAKKALRDSDLRRDVLAALPGHELEDVIEEAQEVSMDRVRAKRAEHDTRPTARQLMGSDRFEPDEFWADNVIVRINRNARELSSLIERGGGLILGAMEMEQAFDYLGETEQLVAEARAAAQEQLRDRAGVS